MSSEEIKYRAQAMKMFAEVDTDKSGTISFDEYFKYRAKNLKNVYAEQKALIKKEFE
jgi:predicted chitinase